MSRAQETATRIREVLLNGRWIANTNFKDQITHTSMAEATLQVEGLNTVALLTFHIHYYVKGLLHVLQGGNLDIKDKYSFDLPEIKSEADWNQLVNTFISDAEAFAGKVAQMDDQALDRVFFDERYGSYLRNIEAIIEHSYYHLGQVSLIRKIIRQKQQA